MILTIMKQTFRYYLDEKEFEVAEVFGDFYSRMILQYVNNQKQAVAALKDLAYEYFSIGYYRNAVKYFLIIKENYGKTVLDDLDLMKLGKAQEKLNRLHDAVQEYQTLIRYFPHSASLKEAYTHMSRIFKLCNNKMKSQLFRTLSQQAGWEDIRLPRDRTAVQGKKEFSEVKVKKEVTRNKKKI